MAKGRGNSTAITVNSATKLDLSYLIQKKLIQKDRQIVFSLNWTNGIEIGAISNYTDKDIYIRLTYRVTDKTTNESKEYDYKIYIAKKKSNLGIGEVLYFVCPESAIYCRKLFNEFHQRAQHLSYCSQANLFLCRYRARKTNGFF
jgi:hypothetical protein